MIVEATYYSVKCDDCPVSSADGSGYSAWSKPGHAEQEWEDAGHWLDEESWPSPAWHLCDYHAPRCECGGRQCAVGDDAPWCEDCVEAVGRKS